MKHVSKSEADRLGVPSDLFQAYRLANEVPDLDDVAQIAMELGDTSGNAGPSTQRKRAGTSSVGGLRLQEAKRVK